MLRRHEGWKEFPDSFTPSRTYITAAPTTPGLRLYWVNHAYDAVIRSSIRDRRGNENVDLLAALRATLREVSHRVDTFRYFTVGGRAHGVVALDLFYASESNGQRLRDWVAAIAAGQPVASVDCVDCSRAELRFTERDLRIVERSLQLVSAPGAWNADRPPQACGPKLDRYSLECALSTATNEIAGRPYFQLAAAWEVIFTAIRRMGPYFETRDQEPQRGFESAFPLRVYNGQPGRTAADVISLLEEVRDRITADLRQRAKQ